MANSSRKRKATSLEHLKVYEHNKRAFGSTPKETVTGSDIWAKIEEQLKAWRKENGDTNGSNSR